MEFQVNLHLEGKTSLKADTHPYSSSVSEHFQHLKFVRKSSTRVLSFCCIYGGGVDLNKLKVSTVQQQQRRLVVWLFGPTANL